MLKRYVRPTISQIRKGQLSHKIILKTLDSVNRNRMPVKTCRNLCYMYMRGIDSYKLLCFARDALPDIKDDKLKMQMVEKMAQKAEGFFICEEVRRYRKTINDDEVKTAQKACDISPVLDLMPMFIAVLVVDGEHGLNVISPIMKEAGVTNADVERIIREIGFDK